ncbi:MAG TPA: DUF2934 domain-containing protein [Gammaproteobacteria bacterium]|jgi:hypothetical protein
MTKTSLLKQVNFNLRATSNITVFLTEEQLMAKQAGSKKKAVIRKKVATKKVAKKKVVKKTAPLAAKKKKAKTTAPVKKQKANVISPQHRDEMIAIAAYYRWEQSGCVTDLEMEHWLLAEQEIDQQLSQS